MKPSRRRSASASAADFMVTCRVSAGLNTRILERAAELGVDRSAWLRQAIEAHLDHGDQLNLAAEFASATGKAADAAARVEGAVGGVKDIADAIGATQLSIEAKVDKLMELVHGLVFQADEEVGGSLPVVHDTDLAEALSGLLPPAPTRKANSKVRPRPSTAPTPND